MTDRSVRVVLSSSVQPYITGLRQAEQATQSFARQGQNAKAPYEQLRTILEQTATAARKLGVAGNDIGRGFGAAVGDVSRLAAAARDLAAVRLATVATDFRRLATALSGMGTSGAAELARLATAMRDLTTGGSGLTNFARDLGRISSALRSFAGSASATTALRDITPALHALGAIGSGTLTTAATDIRRIATAVRTLAGMGGSVATINDIAAALARLGHAGGGIGNLGGINAQLRALQDQINALRGAAGGGGGSGGGGSGGIFGSMFGSLTAANLASSGIQHVLSGIQTAVKNTLSLGIDYQNQLNIMGAVSGATAAQMAEVSAKAIALGNDLSIPGASAADAAQAMTELAKGGLSASQSMAAAQGTLRLAAAAGTDAAAAATVEVNALNAFGLSAGQASMVADQLANTANAATGEISDFSLGMQQSSAASHLFGVSLKDNLTALGLFANAGIKGSDAGTSLKTFLLSFSNTSKPAVAAMKELGVNAFDADHNFVGLASVTDQLSAAHKRMSQQAFIAAAATAFGSDSVRAASVLAAGGTVEWDKMSDSVGKAGGATETAAARMKGLGGALEGLHSQIETAQLQLFTKLAPALEAVTRAATDIFPTVTAAISSAGTGAVNFFKPLIQGATDLALKAWPYVKSFVESLGRGFMSIVGFVKPVADAIGSFFKSIASNGTVDVFGKALAGIGTAFEAVFKFLAPVGSAIGGVVKWFGGLGPVVTTGVIALGAMVLLKGPLFAMFTATGAAAARAAAQLRIFASTGLWTNLGNAARTAGRGLMAAFGGPWGLAITTGITALTLFSGSSDDAATATRDFSGALDENTGKLSANAALVIAQQVQDATKAYQAAGGAVGDYTAAVAGNTDAQSRVITSFQQMDQKAIESSETWGKFQKLFAATGVSSADVAAAFVKGGSAVDDLKGRILSNGDAMYKSGFTANDLTGAFQDLGSKVSGTTGMVGQYTKDVGQFSDTQATATRNAKAAADAQSILSGAYLVTAASLKDLVVQKTPYPTAALIALHNGVADVGKAAATTKTQVADMATQGIRVVTDSATGAIFATDQISSKLVSIGANSKSVIVATTAMSAAYGRYQTAATEATAETGLFLFALQKLSGQDVTMAQAMEAQGASVRGIGAAMRDQAAATDAVTTAKNGLVAAQKKEISSTYTAEQKTLDVAAAQRTYAGAVSDSAASQDKNAQAGRSLQETTAAVMVATANAANAHGGYNAAVKAGEKVMVDARAKFVQQIATFGGTTEATKESTAAANKLADQYGLIPKNVKTILDADPKLATEHAADVKKKLDALAAAKYEAKLEAADNVSGKLTIVQAAMDAMRSKTITLSVETSGGSAAAQAAMDAARTAAAGTHAAGGGIYGAGPKGKDSVLSWLAPGEHVFTDKEVDKMGGQGAVYAFRKNLMAAPGLAAGGVLPGVQVNMDAPGANAAAGNITSFFSRITSAVTSAAQAAANAAAAAAMMAGSPSGLLASNDPESWGWRVGQNIVPFSYGGVDFPGGVAGGTEGIWRSFLAQLVPMIPGGIRPGEDWGYENRDNVNSPGKKSMHAYGLALDVNSSENPNMPGTRGPAGSGKYQIPASADALARRFNMLWGGEWGDAMHFELHETPGQVSGAVGAGSALSSIAASIGAALGGSGVERWRSLANAVAKAKGENPASVQVMLNQMSRESSGDPQAINLTDSNAQAGHPSVGLLQFIPSTFQSYADPGFNSNIYDPQSQMRAWYNYINAVYGGYVSFGQRGYGAYAKGGTVGGSGSGDTVRAMLTPGEEVIPAGPAAAFRPLLKAISGVQHLATGGTVLPSARNLAGYGDPTVTAHLAGVFAALDAFAQAVTDARSHVSDLSQAFIQAHSTTFNATGADKVIAQKKEDAAKAELNAAQHHINTLLALQNAEQRNYRALQSYASRTDALVTRLGVAQANLDSQRSARASLAGSVSGTSTGFGGGLTGHADTRDTFATFLKGQQYDLMQEVKFKDQIKKLGKMGFDSAGLADLAGQGAEAGAGTATALLQGGKGGIGKENLILRQMRTVGKSVGDIAGDAMYGAGIKAGQGLVNGINSQLKFIARASQHLADVGVLRPFAKALQIHSPSQVFHGHGQNIAKGLEQGMISRYDHVNRAVQGMVTVPRGPSFGGGGRGGDVYITLDSSDPLQKAVGDMIRVRIDANNQELTQSVRKLASQPA